MAPSPAIAKIGNRKAPALERWGFSSCCKKTLASFFAYWHYSIYNFSLQYALQKPAPAKAFFVKTIDKLTMSAMLGGRRDEENGFLSPLTQCQSFGIGLGA